MFCYKAAGKELISFSPRIRQPLPSSFVLSIKYFVSLEHEGTLAAKWKRLASVDVLIWTDVAPKACHLLRHYVKNGYRFKAGHVVGRVTKKNKGFFCESRRKSIWDLAMAEAKIPTPEEMNVEKQNGLWAVLGSVLL